MGKIKVRIQRWDFPDRLTNYEVHIRRDGIIFPRWVYCGRASSCEEAEIIASEEARKEIQRRACRAAEEASWRKTRCSVVKKLTY